MNRILGIFFVLPFLLIVNFNITYAAGYGLCKAGTTLKGGELLYLSQDNEKYCWNEVPDNENMSFEDFAKSNYQFTYVFGFKDKKIEFDPIFTVKVKQLKSGNKSIKDKVSLYRKGIRTLCGKRFGRMVDNFVNSSFGEREVDGRLFNSFHKDDKNDGGATLAEFHIWFKNSLGQCERSDSDKLKKYFVIKDIDFAPGKSLAQRIAEVFGLSVTTAFATGKDSAVYEKIRIEIQKGQFRGTELSAHFSLEQKHEYDVIIKDLSSYPEGRFLRSEKSFGIRE